ncbi:hypothetical protein AB9T89_12990 [Flavobacterium oncorhynchi]|uniref:hypothetical protein n=1 Tax=Flavobacterium oncorhynchi TaxID=728056 RepID=UPI00351A4B0E
MNLLRLMLSSTLMTVCASTHAQTVKFIDNKGTLRNLELGIGNIAELYDATGGQTINEGVFSDINFNSPGIVDLEDFSTNTNTNTNTITILTPGRYEVTYRVTTETTNNERNGGEFYLQVAGTESPGTRAYTYSRNNLNNKNTVTVIKIIKITMNTAIKVRGRVYASSKSGTNSTLNMALNGSSLIIKRIK